MTRQALHRSLLRVAMVTLALLLVPAIAMQFSREVAWGPGDFAAAALLLLTGGAAIVLSRTIGKPALRLLAGSAAVLAVALVWAELAVGLFH